MNDDELPGWAYPTREARKLHYFNGNGEPSLCRSYFASMPALMDPPSTQHDVTQRMCCAACWRKSPDHSNGAEETGR